VIRGTIYLTAGQIVFAFSNFVLHAYLGRALGPELYGIFGVVGAFILINEYVLLRGAFETISKFVSEKEEATRAIIKDTLKVLAIGGLILGGIYFIFAEQLASLIKDPELAVYIKLFAFMVPITALTMSFLGSINGLRQFGKQALISIIFSLVRLLTVFILVALGLSVKGAVLGLLIADIFRLVMAKLLCNAPPATASFDGKRMVRFTFQLMTIALITALVMNIDLLAVKFFLQDNFQTGLYTSALTITKMPLFFVIAISLTVLPMVSKSISDGTPELTEKYIRQSLRLIFLFVLPFVVIILATTESCISSVFGDRYVQASGALVILLIGAIFLALKAVLYNIIIASGRPRYIILIGVLSLGIDIALLITLINKFGIIGAATASAITHLFGLVLAYSYVAKKFMKTIIPSFILRIGFACLAIYLIARLYSPIGILLLFYYAFLFCLFFIMLIAMKEINLTEIKLKCSETWEIFRASDIIARINRISS